jgi:beta-lactamase superfamily II metal-dependent hydrolase
MSTVPVGFNGIEVDMLSLGDADCIVVTQWNNSYPHRVLIDGGSGANADVVIDFLHSRGQTTFWAVLCTHGHNDHARGLIKVVQDKSFTFTNGWMHDIRKHISADALRRASAASDGVNEVVENARELASAFANRGIVPREPFAGCNIAGYPFMHVLGPSVPYYKNVLEEFTKVDVPIPLTSPFASLLGAGHALGGPSSPWATLASIPTPPSAISSLIPQSPRSSLAGLFAGVLENSSVKDVPITQPFNKTSVILGVNYTGHRFLFTGDTGADTLDLVPSDWKGLKWMQVPHHGSDGNLSQKNIERFCPEFAYISARGDSSHPSRAIVNGLIKVGTQVFSTHSLNPGHLWFWMDSVPYRGDYGPAEVLKASGGMKSVDWGSLLAATGR